MILMVSVTAFCNLMETMINFEISKARTQLPLVSKINR
jgi:hypothetical protein